MKLTNGEVLWLIRRRFDETVAEMALLFGISEDRYRRWEKDRERLHWSLWSMFPSMVMKDGGVVHPLTAGEACALARRRKGWTLDTLGKLVYRSRVSLIAAEADRVDTAYLVNCWVLIGWPARPRGARIAVALGDWAAKLLAQPR